MKKIIMLFLMFVIVSGLSCGQKGPLYRSDKQLGHFMLNSSLSGDC